MATSMKHFDQINEITQTLAQVAFPLLCKYSGDHDCSATVDISLGCTEGGDFEYYSASAVSKGEAIIQSRVSQQGGWTSVIGICGAKHATALRQTIEEDSLTEMVNEVMEGIGLVKVD